MGLSRTQPLGCGHAAGLKKPWRENARKPVRHAGVPGGRIEALALIRAHEPCPLPAQVLRPANPAHKPCPTAMRKRSNADARCAGQPAACGAN